MSVRITCPACKTTMLVNDSRRGSKVRCKECDKPISVPSETADAIQDLRKVKPKPVPLPKKRVAEAEAQRPSKGKKPQAVKKGFPVLLVVGGGVALLLLFTLVAGAGVGGYLLLRSRPDEAKGGNDRQAKVDAPADDKDKPGPKQDPESKPKRDPEPKAKIDPEPKTKIDPKPKVDPNPAKALPDQMAPEVVSRVKQATVYLRVTMPNGQSAEGSGFFALDPGIVVTNAHVVGMLQSSSRPPTQVDVVLHSGEAVETKISGQVLGVDRACDLAVIRVPINGNMPAPLTLGQEKVFETQKVFIFGFPFGDKLGKNITVSTSNISALRPDPDTRELKDIQVNGGMHPGNSGGPVVNSLGDLVGVSVAGITGTQINFAVPSAKVRSIMEGRLAATKWGEPYAMGDDRRLPVEYRVLDPLNRIQEIRVEVWTGSAGSTRAGSFEQPASRPGDGPRLSHPAIYKDGVGSLDVPLPALKAGDVYWVQPVIKTAKGSHWGPAQATTSAPAFVDRKPADLTINLAAQKDRTSKMTSNYSITLSANKKKTVIAERTSASLLEVVQNPEMKGARKTVQIKTAYSAVSITAHRDGKPIVIPNQKAAEGIVRSMPPTFVVDDSNAIAGYVAVNLSPKHPLRDLVSEFNGMVQNGFEATTFQMPNRVVRPMETFPSKSSMMLRTSAPRSPGQPATIIDLVLSCTYEGTRTRNGREEAILTVTGNLQGRLKLKGKIDGHITGKISFDLAAGFISLANIKIVAENDEQIPGLGSFQEIIAQEIELDRVPGNPMGLALAPEKAPPPPITANGKMIVNQAGILRPNDPPASDPRLRQINSRMQTHPIPMEAGRSYVISLNSTAFDPYLILKSPTGQVIAEDDDSGGNLNARIVFRATQTAVFRAVVTSYDGKLGSFQLIVQELDSGKDSNPPRKGGEVPKAEIDPKAAFVKPMPSPMPTTYMKFTSSPGDFIGGGKSYAYTGSGIESAQMARGLIVSVDGWSLMFGPAKGQMLKVGEYRDAKRLPFNGDSPGLSFYGKGRMANKLSGEFVIWELEMDGPRIVRLAIDFVQRHNEVDPPLAGRVRINSTLQ